MFYEAKKTEKNWKKPKISENNRKKSDSVQKILKKPGGFSEFIKLKTIIPIDVKPITAEKETAFKAYWLFLRRLVRRLFFLHHFLDSGYGSRK